MSALRFLPMLVAVLAACGSVLMSVVSSTDPVTTGCYAPVGDATTGSYYPSDVGYWKVVGLESYQSYQYDVLCAFRVLYQNGPGFTNVNSYGSDSSAAHVVCGCSLSFTN